MKKKQIPGEYYPSILKKKTPKYPENIKAELLKFQIKLKNGISAILSSTSQTQNLTSTRPLER